MDNAAHVKKRIDEMLGFGPVKSDKYLQDIEENIGAKITLIGPNPPLNAMEKKRNVKPTNNNTIIAAFF